MKEHSHYVYILTNKRNGTLYIGVINDIYRRVLEHKTKIVKSFTAKYNIDKLVYYEEYGDIEMSILREKRLKKFYRWQKLELIEKINYGWRDLSNDFLDTTGSLPAAATLWLGEDDSGKSAAYV